MKRSRIITQKPKSVESPNIIDVKSVTIEHPKTSHKLSKTIRQGIKGSQVAGSGKSSSPLYSKATKLEFFLEKKKQK